MIVIEFSSTRRFLHHLYRDLDSVFRLSGDWELRGGWWSRFVNGRGERIYVLVDLTWPWRSYTYSEADVASLWEDYHTLSRFATVGHTLSPRRIVPGGR